MRTRKSYFAGVLLFLWIASSCLFAQDDWVLRRRHPLLMESALLNPPSSVLLLTGVEFEEDSGDFPTTKFPVHVHWILADRIAVSGGFEPLIFNRGEEWWSGLTNSTISGLFGILAADGWQPALSFRQDLLPPTGLFSTGKWNTTSTFLLTWKTDQWRFHVNGAYTFGGHDDRSHIMVSEVDRYRAIAGFEFLPSLKPFTLLFSFATTKPIRPKKFEPVVELGGRVQLARRLIVNIGAGRSLKESAGPDYLLRFTVSVRMN